ncbi:Bbox1 [Phodopus roborovskii]|uniref:gamma-butyrobetaine dioxygenase n=1 Tax=Phodopus roborovskii TaxID=109678 RepID=A0AAU9Z7V8_PHORO|nr:Bbox1 [Phodopus roborovskii]
MHCAMLKAEAVDGAHLMQIFWHDGTESLYPAVWLRDNCQCSECYLHSAKARKLLLEALDVNIRIKDLSFDRKKYWGSELQLPTLNFEDVLKEDEHAYKWLSSLKKVGIVRLTGAADKCGEITKLGKRIGFLYLTFYGHTWQVQDKIDANNVAYTTGKLSFHTDYPALHHPPGVQLLHCIKQTVTGGDSEIVDGFNVCQKLKEKNPQAFHILSSTFVDFTDIGVDYCDFSVQSKHKIIELDDKGQVVRINFNNATRDTVFDVPIERVQPFYSALKEFVDLMNSKEYKCTFKMNPGDVITFDNWRLLHGRRSYEAGTEISRHLEGAYADWDVVMSRLRILRQRVKNGN